MTNPIPWYQSRTIRIGIAQVLGGISGLIIGYYNDDKNLMIGSLGGIATGIGAIWGRAVAVSPIGRPETP